MSFVGFFCHGATKGSTGSGSGFKASQVRDHSLKSHPTDWESQSDKLSFDKAHYDTTDAKVKLFRDTHLQITKGFLQEGNDISLSRISGQ